MLDPVGPVESLVLNDDHSNTPATREATAYRAMTDEHVGEVAVYRKADGATVARPLNHESISSLRCGGPRTLLTKHARVQQVSCNRADEE